MVIMANPLPPPHCGKHDNTVPCSMKHDRGKSMSSSGLLYADNDDDLGMFYYWKKMLAELVVGKQ